MWSEVVRTKFLLLAKGENLLKKKPRTVGGNIWYMNIWKSKIEDKINEAADEIKYRIG